MKIDYGEIFAQYLRDLREFPPEAKTEHSDRGALQTLLKAFASQAEGKPKVQHEPKRIAEKGAPDFKVTKTAMILGYVENKAVGENLSKVLKSDQIAKYKTLSQNIILTDYLEFVWITKDGIQRARLCEEDDLANRKFRLREDRIEAVSHLLRAFFSSVPKRIGDSETLAIKLAERCKVLKSHLVEELERQEREHQEGKLYVLYTTFRDQIFHELTLSEFADAYAQMLAYGLFLARLNAKVGVEITLGNARDHVPGSFQLIHELVEFLTELNRPEYIDVKWVVEEVLSIVNNLDLASIHEDLSFRQRKAINRKVRAGDEEEHRLFERDPFVYFYEDFLKAYDKETRKSRGVYYTPPPIVKFIIRAIDDILKDSFSIKEGLANNKVTVLDFACGTGTFLLEAFQRIFENIGGPDVGKADKIVSDHILKNIYGFEYLIAPYTIAHLKLSQYLREKGHPLKDKERLQVFLTNTVEPIKPQKNLWVPAITAEVEAAQAVKEKPIRVITGNPPYSGHSKNKGPWITTQIAKYREGFPELSKPAQGKWLQDDYVKFIRFAQMKMDGGIFEYTDEDGNLQSVKIEGVDKGIVGIITNHSYLDNPTFKGMRKSLMESFDQIYILDLHGNTKKKERAPDGSADNNVFDIEQGVAVAIFVKNPELEKGVWHSDLWGKRQAKYEFVAQASRKSISWNKIEPASPEWLFKAQDEQLAASFAELWSVPSIFRPLGDPAPGFATQHDDFAISYAEPEALAKVKSFLASKDEAEARTKFELCAQNQWQFKRAKKELAEIDVSSLTQEITYRPFDNRWTIWNRNVAVHRRLRVTQHLLNENIALIVAKNSAAIGSRTYDGVSIANKPVELNYFRRGGEYVFPIRLFTENGESVESFSADFHSFLDARYDHRYSPEEILGYIYAVLYALTYRIRYAEFLRIDFPRIPFSEKKSDFDVLSKLGWELVQAHLLKTYPDAGLAKYHGKGDHEVEAVRYSDVEKAVWINKDQRFKPVPEDVWNFHIGGYQVIEKYLKSRKDRTLSLDEINHVAAIADSLAFTIAQMTRIDAAYQKAFPAVDKSAGASPAPAV